MNNEFKRMQKLAGLITENMTSSTKVYKSNPFNELYKVTNFPEGDLQDENMKDVLNTIYLDSYSKPISELINNGFTEEVERYLNDLKSHQQVYVYTDGEGRLTITDSLKIFDEGYQTEKEWKVKNWVEI